MIAGPPPCPRCGASGLVFRPDPPLSPWGFRRIRCPACHGERTLEPEPVAAAFPEALARNPAQIGSDVVVAIAGEMNGSCVITAQPAGEPDPLVFESLLDCLERALVEGGLPRRWAAIAVGRAE